MQHAKGSSQKTNRALDARQKHLLNKWIESSIGGLEGKTREEIAVISSQELAFNVSTSSITTALTATGLMVRGISKQKKYRKNWAALLDTVEALCKHAGLPFCETLKQQRGHL